MTLCMLEQVGLEELLTYHEAEFEITDGYYYELTVAAGISRDYGPRRTRTPACPAC